MPSYADISFEIGIIYLKLIQRYRTERKYELALEIINSLKEISIPDSIKRFISMEESLIIIEMIS